MGNKLYTEKKLSAQAKRKLDAVYILALAPALHVHYSPQQAFFRLFIDSRIFLLMKQNHAVFW